jgi:hypothetical protein
MLATRFIGLFKILEKRGEVAYQLELLPQLSDVHVLFHVSQLKKCLRLHIGGHKMHIFIANIPTFHSRY